MVQVLVFPLVVHSPPGTLRAEPVPRTACRSSADRITRVRPEERSRVATMAELTGGGAGEGSETGGISARSVRQAVSRPRTARSPAPPSIRGGGAGGPREPRACAAPPAPAARPTGPTGAPR